MSTQNDKLVLNTIFNPFEPTKIEADQPIDGICPIESHQKEEKPIPDLERLKQLEIEGAKLADAGKLDESLELFNQIVKEAPTYASALNNRAQVYQLKGNIERASLDIKSAMELVDIDGCRCLDKNKVLSQALCQRALISRFHNDETNAYADLQRAAKLGSEFAKTQVVKLNPYAALCNSMLNQMITKLRNGDAENV